MRLLTCSDMYCRGANPPSAECGRSVLSPRFQADLPPGDPFSQNARTEQGREQLARKRHTPEQIIRKSRSGALGVLRHGLLQPRFAPRCQVGRPEKRLRAPWILIHCFPSRASRKSRLCGGADVSTRIRHLERAAPLRSGHLGLLLRFVSTSTRSECARRLTSTEPTASRVLVSQRPEGRPRPRDGTTAAQLSMKSVAV
jgi:hypothetical protein